jgi:phasin family protein
MTDAGAKKSGFMAFSMANNGLPYSGPEVETIFASQRKNVEAIMQANRLAFDGVRAVWLRQLGFLQEAVEGLTTHVGDLAPPSSPLNEKFAKHAEYSKQAFEKNLANACELTEIATKVTADATNIINQRFYESLDEVPYLRKRNGETTSS